MMRDGEFSTVLKADRDFFRRNFGGEYGNRFRVVLFHKSTGWMSETIRTSNGITKLVRQKWQHKRGR